jgi:hypothetical protein
VRICDATGNVFGAGVLLGGEHVLTCAHVALNAGPGMMVEFADLPDAPPVGVRTEVCVPLGTDERGDVALLRLDRPVGGQVGIPLRRMALSRDRGVRVLGFPRGLEYGVWTRAVLGARAGPGGEWLQMNTRLGEQRVREGFSGAGVVDDRTGAVLGIVVGRSADTSANLSWMMPAETVLHYIPRVAEWIIGDPVADETFSGPVPSAADHGVVAQALASWLARQDTGDVVMIVVGNDLAALYQAVALSSRGAEGEAPVVGSIDLALDASGKSVERISRRILERAGVPVDDTASSSEQVRAGTPPMTIVVDGVDDAEQPEVLLNEVLKPLAERESRLVLGFRRPSSPSLEVVRAWDVGSVGSRLSRLAEKVSELDAIEQKLMAGTARVHASDLPVTDRAGRLWPALSGLRAVAAVDPEATRRHLETCERTVARALRDVRKAAGDLDELLDERRELQGRLDAYKAKANDGGLVEDVPLADVHRRAYELLWRSPTDLPAAREAVRTYQRAVRRALQDGTAGERP